MSITKNEIKIIKSLRTKKGRLAENLYLAEGVRLLEEAYRCQVLPRKLYSNESLLSDRGNQLLGRFHKKHVTIEEVPKKMLESLAPVEASQGILGVFDLPDIESSESLTRDIRNVLWCENISDPGNVGTLLRSALAFGFSTVLISGATVDIFSPKVVRASSGAIFGLQVYKNRTDSLLSFIGKLQQPLVAADIRGENWFKTLKNIKKYSTLTLAVGAEATGLSDSICSRADLIISISHTGRVESLNAAVAGSIIMSDYYAITMDSE